RGYGDAARFRPPGAMACRGAALPAILPARVWHRGGRVMKQAVLQKPSPVRPVNGDLRMHRFTVDEYHHMIDAGILTKYHRVELLNGWIVDKMAQNPPHPFTLNRFNRWLLRVLPEPDWVVRVQSA